MKGLGIIAGLLALTGCGPSDKLPEEDIAGTVSLPKGLTVFAACGTSIGRVYYQEPEDGGGWEDDRVTGGRYVFGRDGAGKLHILYYAAGRQWVDEAADGGTVVEVRSRPEDAGVEALVYYPESGVMETYSVHGVADGGRWLLWTSNKHVVGVLTKVAAYRAKCA